MIVIWVNTKGSKHHPIPEDGKEMPTALSTKETEPIIPYPSTFFL